MKKPLNKYNKAELYELAKENKDTIRILNLKLNMYSTDIENLNASLGEYGEKINIYNTLISKLNKALLNKTKSFKDADSELKKKNKKNKPEYKSILGRVKDLFS